MKIRVRPREIGIYSWTVEAFHPEQKKWIEVIATDFYWFAKWRGKRLSKQDESIMMNKKDKKNEFVGRLDGSRRKEETEGTCGGLTT